MRGSGDAAPRPQEAVVKRAALEFKVLLAYSRSRYLCDEAGMCGSVGERWSPAECRANFKHAGDELLERLLEAQGAHDAAVVGDHPCCERKDSCGVVGAHHDVVRHDEGCRFRSSGRGAETESETASAQRGRLGGAAEIKPCAGAAVEKGGEIRGAQPTESSTAVSESWEPQPEREDAPALESAGSARKRQRRGGIKNRGRKTKNARTIITQSDTIPAKTAAAHIGASLEWVATLGSVFVLLFHPLKAMHFDYIFSDISFHYSHI